MAAAEEEKQVLAPPSPITAALSHPPGAGGRPFDVIHADANYRFITISPPVDYTAMQWDLIVDWHRRMCIDQCLVVFEDRPGDGVKHLHSVISVKAKGVNHTTVSLERLLSRHNIEWCKIVTIKVKDATDVSSLYTYLMKDQTGPPALLLGWRLSWIKQKLKDNVKLLKPSDLKKGRRVLNINNAVPLIQAYAFANGHRLNSKEAIADCMCDMQYEKYSFDRCKFETLYCQLMGECGIRRSFRDFLMDKWADLS